MLQSERERLEESLVFRVDQWDKQGNNLDRILSRSSNLLVARAAFLKACEQYPGQYLTLRHGARLIETRCP